MNRIRTLSLALGILAVLFASTAARAEKYKGTFTLPFEVSWGAATLPPGDYSFALDTDKGPHTVTVRGPNEAAMVMPSGKEGAKSGSSALVLIRTGNRGIVRQLRLVEAGQAFNYGPEEPRGRFIAQRPELLQRIPVYVSAGR